MFVIIIYLKVSTSSPCKIQPRSWIWNWTDQWTNCYCVCLGRMCSTYLAALFTFPFFRSTMDPMMMISSHFTVLPYAYVSKWWFAWQLCSIHNNRNATGMSDHPACRTFHTGPVPLFNKYEQRRKRKRKKETEKGKKKTNYKWQNLCNMIDESSVRSLSKHHIKLNFSLTLYTK